MKTKHYYLLALLLMLLGGGNVSWAQTSEITAVTTHTWNFSDFDATSYSAATVVNNLLINAESTDKKIEIDGSNKTFDGISYSKRLKLGGSGSSTSPRNVAFKVAGNCNITIHFAHASSSGDARSLALKVGDSEEATKTVEAGGTATQTYEYRGDSEATAYVYSKNSGINIYAIIVEAVTTGDGLNTFEWILAKPISDVDQLLLNDTQDPWVLANVGWRHDGGSATAGEIAQNGKVLEHFYGLQAHFSAGDNNTILYTTGYGLRLNSGDGRYLTIPGLKAGDKVTVVCNNYNSGRGLVLPSNINNDATATGWGNYDSTGEFTCEGVVAADGDVQLKGTSAIEVKSVTVKSANKPWPALSFANGSKVEVNMPYGATSTTYTNTLTAPSGCGAVSYSVLSGQATVDGTGQVTINGTESVVVRATVAEGNTYGAYYCDYIINVTGKLFTMFDPDNITYEWRFNNPDWWVTEGSQLGASWWLDTNSSESIYKYNNNNNSLNNVVLPLAYGGETALPETNNLTFTAQSNRVGVKIGNYLWLNADAAVELPALWKGAKITVRARTHSDSSTLAATGTTETEAQTVSTAEVNYVFTVAEDGKQVTLTNGSSQMRILSIKVEKASIAYFDGIGSQSRSFMVNAGAQNGLYVTFRDGSTNLLTLGSDEWSHTTLTSDDESILTVAKNGNDNSNRGTMTITPVKKGTTNVRIKVEGSKRYNDAEGTIAYTITGVPNTLTLENSSPAAIAYSDYQGRTGNDRFHDVATAAEGYDGTIAYTSGNTNVAEVDADGYVTVKNAGTTVITATAPATAIYDEATAQYTLTVSGTEAIAALSWSQADGLAVPQSIKYGNNDLVKAEVSQAKVQGYTLVYESSDESIATVEQQADGSCKITAVGNGPVTIVARIEGQGAYEPVQITASIDIIGGEVTFAFLKDEGTVTRGYTITPYVKAPNVKTADFSRITVRSSDTSIAKVAAGNVSADDKFAETVDLTVANGGIKEEGGDIKGMLPTIKGLTVGDATITITLESSKYQTATIEYKVHVVESSLNFAWEAPSQVYTIYTGDYMMIPAITGNANGNWDYSLGSSCQSKEAYLYGMRKNSPIWNYADFKVGEGYPNYRLTESPSVLEASQKSSNQTTKAYVVWASANRSVNDTLMIYAKEPGTVYLHAYDAQTGTELGSTITINIKDKATLAASMADYVRGMSYPYTWDFTTDFPVSASPNYWEPHYNGNSVDYYICGYSTMFNWDYCDQDGDENINEAMGNDQENSVFNKYFVNTNTEETDKEDVMPQFYGLTIYSGNSGDTNTKSYEAKRDKLRIATYKDDNTPRLDVVGGVHYLRMPNPTTILPGDENFRLVVKAVPTGDKCTLYKFKNGDHATSGEGSAVWKEISGKTPSIVMFDVTAGEISGDNYIELGVSDVKIYWIAMSTEAKAINPAAGGSGDGVEMMATYSYDKAMDYAKSGEANRVNAYIATGLTWNDAARNLSVTMQLKNTEVATRTGVVLRTKDKASSEQATFADWVNNKNANNQEGTDYLSTHEANGLKVESNKNGWVTVEECSVKVGDNTYTKRLNLLGKGGTGVGRRYLTFSVSGPTDIAIVCEPVDGTKGNKLYIGTDGNAASPLHTLSSAAGTYNYSYNGDGATIYVYGTEGTSETTDNTGNAGYGIRIYGITKTTKGLSAYMIADAQNEKAYTEPAVVSENKLVSTWATDVAQPTLYRNAANETGTAQGDTHIPFIFSSQYTRTATGDQYHDAGYYSFWRIKSNSITAGKNMAYIVLDKATYGNAANANGKADDIAKTMESSDSRMAIRFVDEDDDPYGGVSGIGSYREEQGIGEPASGVGSFYYDLGGRRVSVPSKGLYIRNGKKILVK